MRKSNLFVFTLFMLIGAQFSCSSSDNGGEPTPTGPSVDELIAQGWQAFESGDFQTANSRFNEARQKDSGPVEIFTGLGWSFLRLDNLAQARNEFNAGRSFCRLGIRAERAERVPQLEHAGRSSFFARGQLELFARLRPECR